MESEKKFGLVETLRTVICALHLTITFLVLSVKKRSPWQAILLLASTGATMTALLLPEEKIKSAVERTKKKVTPVDEESEVVLPEEEVIEEEIFTAEESARAEAKMRETLCGNNDEESVSPSAKREIPRDEEASEEDFH